MRAQARFLALTRKGRGVAAEIARWNEVGPRYGLEVGVQTLRAEHASRRCGDA